MQRIEHPIVIVGAPRSGTTILQRCIAQHPEVWHLPRESHGILEGPFHPRKTGYTSNRVGNDKLDPEVVESLRRRFYDRAINLDRVMRNPAPLLTGGSASRRLARGAAMAALGPVSRIRKPAAIRFLEKTPKNCLRLPFLEILFPDALYISLRRRAADNIDSLMAGWRATDRAARMGRPRYAFAGYAIAGSLQLRDYSGRWWKFALVPGWRALKGSSIGDVAAWQYYQCNRFMVDDLDRIASARLFALKYEDFVERPVELLREIQLWAGLEPSPAVEAFATVFPRVNDATPQIDREVGQLREPGGVRAAMERLPELERLRDELGYHEDPRWHPEP